MFKVIKKRFRKVGLPPGTLIHIGEKLIENVKITVIDYDAENWLDIEIETIEECFRFKGRPSVTWINITGLHQVEIIEKLGRHFELHPLLLEDVVNTDQRPKLEDYGEYYFIVLKSLDFDSNSDEITMEQVSIVLHEDIVITFQERDKDLFKAVKKRIKDGKGVIRKRGTDYLAYSLIDTIVDDYFIILEEIGERIEEIETALITEPTLQVLQEIHFLKREMLILRKSIWPLRAVTSNLERRDSVLIQESTVRYLRDVYDHIIQIIDSMETFRDMLTGLLDLYLSSVSNKMNEIMKMLTIIATIFIPITFIAGIYGMNFKYMPELDWYWGYPLIWLIIIVIASWMLVYFRRKRWL